MVVNILLNFFSILCSINDIRNQVCNCTRIEICQKRYLFYLSGPQGGKEDRDFEIFWLSGALIFTRMSHICTVNLTDPSSYKMCLPDLNEYYSTCQFFVSAYFQGSGSNSWKIKRNLFFPLVFASCPLRFCY